MIVAFDNLSESNVIFCLGDPDANPFANIGIGNDEDIPWANTTDSIALVSKTIDFYIHDLTLLDWW